MKNVTAVTTTTVKIEYTTAPTIRCVARKDMPEYGILEGSCFYLARSSKNDGTYYLLRWDYERIEFHCSCPARKPCRHMKAVNADCKKLHTIHSCKPVSKAEKFDVLKALYDIRKASEAEAEKAANWQAQGFSPRDEAYYAAKERHTKIMNDAQALSIECDRKRRETAPLHTNKGFSLLK